MCVGRSREIYLSYTGGILVGGMLPNARKLRCDL